MLDSAQLSRAHDLYFGGVSPFQPFVFSEKELEGWATITETMLRETAAVAVAAVEEPAARAALIFACAQELQELVAWMGWAFLSEVSTMRQAPQHISDSFYNEIPEDASCRSRPVLLSDAVDERVSLNESVRVCDPAGQGGGTVLTVREGANDAHQGEGGSALDLVPEVAPSEIPEEGGDEQHNLGPVHRARCSLCGVADALGHKMRQSDDEDAFLVLEHLYHEVCGLKSRAQEMERVGKLQQVESAAQYSHGTDLVSHNTLYNSNMPRGAPPSTDQELRGDVDLTEQNKPFVPNAPRAPYQRILPLPSPNPMTTSLMKVRKQVSLICDPSMGCPGSTNGMNDDSALVDEMSGCVRSPPSSLFTPHARLHGAAPVISRASRLQYTPRQRTECLSEGAQSASKDFIGGVAPANHLLNSSPLMPVLASAWRERMHKLQAEVQSLRDSLGQRGGARFV